MFGDTIITPRPPRPLHEIVEAFVQVGVNRLGRNEHQRDVLRLARNQVFVGDVGDVLGNVLLDALAHRQLALIVVWRLAQRRHRFEREFGVDDQTGRSPA